MTGSTYPAPPPERKLLLHSLTTTANAGSGQAGQSSVDAAPPSLIPREVLFGNPERVSPALSPDGTRLAWLAPHDGVLNVWVRAIDSPQHAARAVTDDHDRGI